MPHTVGKSEYLGADLLFPLLVGVLTHSRLPNVHLILVIFPDTSPLSYHSSSHLLSRRSHFLFFFSLLLSSHLYAALCFHTLHCPLVCSNPLSSILFSSILTWSTSINSSSLLALCLIWPFSHPSYFLSLVLLPIAPVIAALHEPIRTPRPAGRGR
jgi:hypothetical protein